MPSHLAETPVICPHCGRSNEVFSGANTQEPPTEGAVSLCWGCHEPALHTADRTLRSPTPEERKDILADPTVREVLHAMREAYTPQQVTAMVNPEMPLELND